MRVASRGGNVKKIKGVSFQWAIPFNVHIPLKGCSKSISEGLCLSASFDHCVFLRGKAKNSKFLRGILCRHFDLFFLKIFKAHSQGVCGY